MRSRILLALLAASALAAPARAQCPRPQQFDGDEPDDFTHCIDADAGGICQAVAEKVNGAYPNASYPTCTCPDGSPQVGHGHWEYTSLHHENQLGESEEKDYATETQAMEQDFENRDPNGTQTRHAFDQTMRFTLHEPERFDRFLRAEANPEGRYWQVDEWIGPGGSPGQAPGLTWTERFFTCGGEKQGGTSACATVNGTPAYGGYWSTHAEQFGYQNDCGDPLVADPAASRSPNCGMLFVTCP